MTQVQMGAVYAPGALRIKRREHMKIETCSLGPNHQTHKASEYVNTKMLKYESVDLPYNVNWSCDGQVAQVDI